MKDILILLVGTYMAVVAAVLPTLSPTLAPVIVSDITEVTYTIKQVLVNITYQKLSLSQQLASFENAYACTLRDVLQERLVYPSTISPTALPYTGETTNSINNNNNVTMVTQLVVILEYSSYNTESELLVAVQNTLRITSEAQTFIKKLKTYIGVCNDVVYVTSVESPRSVTQILIISTDEDSDTSSKATVSLIMIITIIASAIIILICLIAISFEIRRYMKTKHLRSIVDRYNLVNPYERFAPEDASSRRASNFQKVKSAFILPDSSNISRRISTLEVERIIKSNSAVSVESHNALSRSYDGNGISSMTMMNNPLLNDHRRNYDETTVESNIALASNNKGPVRPKVMVHQSTSRAALKGEGRR